MSSAYCRTSVILFVLRRSAVAFFLCSTNHPHRILPRIPLLFFPVLFCLPSDYGALISLYLLLAPPFLSFVPLAARTHAEPHSVAMLFGLRARASGQYCPWLFVYSPKISPRPLGSHCESFRLTTFIFSFFPFPFPFPLPHSGLFPPLVLASTSFYSHSLLGFSLRSTS